jgi:DNA-binding NarL/FixJ family response regulator
MTLFGPITTRRELPYALLLLLALQVFCAGFFLIDVAADFLASGGELADGHLVVETLAAIALVAAIVLETRWLMWLLRRKAHLERSVSTARAAVQDVIEQHFADWRLTPSEADIANFLVKGLSISEIAAARGSAEGTVKSHLNAIYRKAGATGRGDLMALILDGLMGQGPHSGAA